MRAMDSLTRSVTLRGDNTDEHLGRPPELTMVKCQIDGCSVAERPPRVVTHDGRFRLQAAGPEACKGKQRSSPASNPPSSAATHTGTAE